MNLSNARNSPGFLHLYNLEECTSPWLHMCIRHLETGEYLMQVAMLDDLIVEAMIAEDTRSRIRVRDDGIMVLLKTMHVQGDEMAKPEDMISIRIWIDENQVITTREADVDSIDVIANRVKNGHGPKTSGDFLADIIEVHLDEIDPYLEGLEDKVDNLEDMISRHMTEMACPGMVETQSRISGFLRHLKPQQPVLETLRKLDHPVLSERNRSRFDDALNQLLQILETLENLRERIDIINSQVSRIQDRQLNRSSYSFAVAAMVFLPLGFITGLFGVNLPGIPLADNTLGFWILIGLCTTLVGVIVWIFRLRRWL